MVVESLTIGYNTILYSMYNISEELMTDRDISNAVIGRLPRYYRYLGELRDQGILRISSQELSDIMNVTASQIRQDFNNFGGFGQQGYGYNVELLCAEISRILGMDQIHSMVIIGAGHLGQALAGYNNFAGRGFIFRGAFDCDEAVIGRRIGDIVVMPVDELEEFIRNNDIEIAVLTVPKGQAVSMAKRLVDCGIKAIWNFAHVDLDVPADVQVENVHLSDSLMRLSFMMTQVPKQGR